MGSHTLRYDGGESLTFRDGSGARRRVARGETFRVDEKTARILLDTDPSVTDTSSPVTATEDVSGLTVSDLKERLEAAGLETKGSRPELAERYAAYQATSAASTAETIGSSPASPDPSSSEAELVAPPPEGGSQPGAGPTEMAGPPTASATGAVTLGDIPPGGTVSGKSSGKSS